MKQFYILGVIILASLNINAQIVNIPDAQFKSYVLALGDLNNDNELQVSEAELFTDLDLMFQPIYSLEGINSFINLETLNCGSTNLSSLDVSSLTSLRELHCGNSQLTSLEVNNALSLEVLNFSHNQLTNINLSSLINLNTLTCHYNQLTDLDLSNLNELEVLRCNDNQLVNLNVNGLPNLATVLCNNNQLVTLDVSSSTNLNYLNCNYNDLTSLNVTGLSNLERLYFGYNNINNLDFTTLVGLRDLTCAANGIVNLDLSNLTNLETLYCDYNEILNLELTNLTNLNSLSCRGNQITSLDTNNLQGLTSLTCTYNDFLTNLYIKNGSIETILELDYSTLEFICADENQIEDIQNQIDNEGSSTSVTSYCSFVPGGDYFTIQGENKLDLDANGCNVSDANFPNLKFNITDGIINGTIISNSTGSYSIPVQAGIHTITPILENPTYFTVTPTNVVVDFPTETSPFSQNFCVLPNGTHNDLEIVFIPVEQARPGFEVDYKIVYKNKGNTELTGSVNLMFQDDLMDLALANPIVDNQVVNELTWNFTNLLPYESRVVTFSMNLNAPTDTPPLNDGNVLGFTASINPVSGDEMPDDNVHVFNQTVVNSLDPNNKTCLEGQTITPVQVGKFVHYMIRFENIGTASAVNIVVKDEIDLTKYDVSTLIPLDGSHEFVTRIKDDNIVEFIFEDINLPFDDANNDGYVLFKIKTLNSLVLGDAFSNNAEIYFDYNFPIITNDETTTVAVLSTEEFEFVNNLTLYPNPTSNTLYIEASRTLTSIEIYNILGQQMLSTKPNAITEEIDMSELNSGIYLVKVKIGEQTATYKIVKE